MPQKVSDLASGDKNVVSNIRGSFGDKVKAFSDKQLAVAWYHYSLSDEFPDGNFLTWPQSFVDTDYPEGVFR